jgi:hypothetical protein
MPPPILEIVAASIAPVHWCDRSVSFTMLISARWFTAIHGRAALRSPESASTKIASRYEIVIPRFLQAAGCVAALPRNN